MREGLYKVQFQTALGMGYGVVYAKDGKMWGGDYSMFYVGSFEEHDDHITAVVRVNKHTDEPSFPTSVLGVDTATLTLKGKVAGNSIITTGTAKEAPGVTFQARLDHISD